MTEAQGDILITEVTAIGDAVEALQLQITGIAEQINVSSGVLSMLMGVIIAATISIILAVFLSNV